MKIWEKLRRFYFRVFLPFEDADGRAPDVEQRDDTDEALREILGDEFVDRLNYQFPKEVNDD